MILYLSNGETHDLIYNSTKERWKYEGFLWLEVWFIHDGGIMFQWGYRDNMTKDEHEQTGELVPLKIVFNHDGEFYFYPREN